jgi:hypothetical protein
MATFAGARHEREPLETHGAGAPALHVLSAIEHSSVLRCDFSGNPIVATIE